jgi:hypothetical protein
MRQLVTLYSVVLTLAAASLLDAQTPVTVRPQTVTPATQINPATLTVTPTGTLQQQIAALQAAVVALQVKTQLLSSDGTNLMIAAPGSISFKAQRQVLVQSTQTTVAGAANLALTGAVVQINGGGHPAAELGSPVAGNQVVAGSPTVLIP